MCSLNHYCCEPCYLCAYVVISDRYRVSKLMGHILAMELAERLSSSSHAGAERVTTSVVNPGWVKTEILRNAPRSQRRFVGALGALIARTPVEGGKILVNAAEGGRKTTGSIWTIARRRGEWDITDFSIVLTTDERDSSSAWAVSADGLQTRKKLWAELTSILEEIQPGIMSNI